MVGTLVIRLLSAFSYSLVAIVVARTSVILRHVLINQTVHCLASHPLIWGLRPVVDGRL